MRLCSIFFFLKKKTFSHLSLAYILISKYRFTTMHVGILMKMCLHVVSKLHSKESAEILLILYFFWQLLNKRIETFISSYRNSNISYPDTKPYIDDELNKLQRRWDDFKNQSLQLKNKLSAAQQYYNLLENVSEIFFWYILKI